MKLFSLLLFFLTGSISLCFAAGGLVKNAPLQMPSESAPQVDFLVANQVGQPHLMDGLTTVLAA